MNQYRAIRALYDDDDICLYAAFNAEIADAAIREQNLSASPTFRFNRMTWIKPSWCWMMYRCGYSYKDADQERVLALRIRHENFRAILRHTRLATNPDADKAHHPVIVQWDPERSPRIGRLDHRSIQIGITRELLKQFVDEWIESIEDVTEAARQLKQRLDENSKVDTETLIGEGLMPKERPYEVPDDIKEILEMERS